MALLAIDRTQKGTWAETSGERYRPFYEGRVKELLKQAEDEGKPINLSAIEFPVTICWFPEYAGPGRNPHKAARKVFVDVNQNAKKPSESRLILLSDTELDNMFARNLLSRVRDKESTIDLPLYSIEYDNPEQTTTPTRWSVLTNLEILRAMVQRAVFGPVEHIQSLDALIAAARGRQNDTKMGARLAEQLDLLNYLPSAIKDGPRTIERSKITRLHFPVYDAKAQKQLIDRFYEKWGAGLLRFLLASTIPQSSAAQTLVRLASNQASLRTHRLTPPPRIHTDLTQLPPNDRLFAGVTLQLTVSGNGRVDAAKATAGPPAFFAQAEDLALHQAFTPFTVHGSIVPVLVQDYVPLLPPEQWLPHHTPLPDAIDPATLSFTLTRTACLGACPAYQLTLHGDGRVDFTGQFATLIAGSHTARIPTQPVQDLLAAFRRADFLSAQPEYRASVTDCPTYTLTLHYNGQTKQVVDYEGAEEGIPDAVQDLEDALDLAAGSARWVRGDATTLPSLQAEHYTFSSRRFRNRQTYTAVAGSSDPALHDLLAAFLAANAPWNLPPPRHLPDGTEQRLYEAPICAATGQANLDAVRQMLDLKLPLTAELRQQCLLAAASAGSVPLLDLWIDHGAQPIPIPKPSHLTTAPSSAADAEADEQTEARDRESVAVLAAGIHSGNPEMVDRLLRLPFDLHSNAYDMGPVLPYVFQGHYEDRLDDRAAASTLAILQFLLAHGADPNAPDIGGQTPLFAASQNPAIIAPLLAAGAHVDARDTDGRTPLLYNAEDEASVRALLAAGADPATQASNGDTPLAAARKADCAPCATLLQAALEQRLATPVP